MSFDNDFPGDADLQAGGRPKTAKRLQLMQRAFRQNHTTWHDVEGRQVAYTGLTKCTNCIKAAVGLNCQRTFVVPTFPEL